MSFRTLCFFLFLMIVHIRLRWHFSAKHSHRMLANSSPPPKKHVNFKRFRTFHQLFLFCSFFTSPSSTLSNNGPIFIFRCPPFIFPEIDAKIFFNFSRNRCKVFFRKCFFSRPPLLDFGSLIQNREKNTLTLI